MEYYLAVVCIVILILIILLYKNVSHMETGEDISSYLNFKGLKPPSNEELLKQYEKNKTLFTIY